MFRLGGADAPLRFLLEGVQGIDEFGKPDSIGRAVGVPVVVLDDLEDASAAKALQRFGARVLAPQRRIEERQPDVASDFGREGAQIFPVACQPTGLVSPSTFSEYIVMVNIP